MIFIGYESSVRETAEKIRDILEERKLDVKMDDTDINAGEKVRKKITSILAEEIKCMIMVLPKGYNLLENSGWVHFEVGYALSKDVKIIPIIVNKNTSEKEDEKCTNSKSISPNYLNDIKSITYDDEKEEMNKLYNKLESKYRIKYNIVIYDEDFKNKRQKRKKRYDYPNSKVYVASSMEQLEEILMNNPEKPSILLVDLFSERTGYPTPSEKYKKPKIRKTFAKSVNEDLLEFQNYRTKVRKKVFSAWAETGIHTFERIIANEVLNERLKDVPKAIFSRYGRLFLETKSTHFLTKNSIYYCWKMKDVDKSFKVCKKEFKLEFNSIKDIIDIAKKTSTTQSSQSA